MEEILLKNIPFELDLKDLTKRLRIDAESEDYVRLKELLEQAKKIARPKALCRVSYIEDKGNDFVVINGTIFHSRVLRSNLDKIHRVFPYVATCGVEIEEWSLQFDDLLEKFWVDTMKEMILKSAMAFFNEHLKKVFALNKIASMNPGSLEDWPLREQKILFAVLGKVDDLIGVKLTASCLMIPSKSVSGIYFPTETNYENCRLCSRKNCPGRRAPFDEEFFNEMLK